MCSEMNKEGLARDATENIVIRFIAVRKENL